MANARASSLQGQRSTFGYGRFGGATRVSTSLSSSASSIAKNAQGDELSAMTSKYNDGVIGNEEMRAFLQKMLGSSLLSASEKTEVESRLRDFDVRIRVGQMEANYKNAPDNSIAKIQSAQTMGNYYRSLAGTLQPDTPAYSNYMEKAGQWDQVAVSETSQANKSARAIKRSQLFTEVYKSPPGSSEEAFQKYQAFVELANQANADGDVQAATQFSMYAQQAYSDAQATQVREQESAQRESAQGNRKALNDYINSTMNDYKDGKISAEQAMINLNAADEQASALGETSINVRLNTLAQGIYTDVQKGRSYETSESGNFGFKSAGGSSVSGDELLFDINGGGLIYANQAPQTSTKSGGTAKGKQTAGSKQTLYEKALERGGNVTVEEFEAIYKQNKDINKQRYLRGEINGTAYKNSIAILEADRAQEIAKRLGILEQMNPNAKIKMNGKKYRVADLLETFNSRIDESTKNAEFLTNPNIAPKTKLSNGKYDVGFEEIGTLSDKGKKWIFNSQGEKVQIGSYKDVVDLQLGEGQAVPAGYKEITDINSPDFGRYERTNRFVDVDDARTGKVLRYVEDPNTKQWVPDFKEPGGQSELWDDASKQMKIYKDYIAKSKETVRPMTQAQLEQFIKSKAYEKVLGKDYMLDTDPTRPVQIVQPGKAFSMTENNKINAPTVISATRPLNIKSDNTKALEQEIDANPGLAVVRPISQNLAPEGYQPAITPGVSKPQSNVAQQIQTGLNSGGLKIISQPSKPQVSSTPAVSLSLPKVNQAVKSGGLSVQQQGSTKAPPKAPSLLDQAKKIATGIGTKIKSFFGW